MYNFIGLLCAIFLFVSCLPLHQEGSTPTAEVLAHIITPSQLVIQSLRYIYVFPAFLHSTVITCGNFGEFFSMPKIGSSQKPGWGHATLIPFYCCCQGLKWTGIIIQSNSIRRSSTLFTNIFHWETEWEITMTLNNLMVADKVVDVSFCKAYLVVFLYWLQSWAPGTRCQGHVWHQAVLLV